MSSQGTAVLFRDETGEATDGLRYTYDGQGRDIQVTAFGVDHYTVVNRTFDEFGNCVQEAYIDDENGQLVETSAGYSMIRYSYDVFGNMTDRWIYDEAGNPCGNEFHEAYTYSVTGQTLTEEYYDTEEQLIRRTVLTYDIYGRQIGVQFYEADGSCYIYGCFLCRHWCNPSPQISADFPSQKTVA